MMKRVLITALCLLGVAFPVMADQKDIVENLLKEKTEAVLKILPKDDIDEQVKRDKIMEIVGPIIDFQLMAKLTLGKTNWGKLSEKQQTEFVDLFVKRLEKSYLDKSSMYCCVEISYKQAFAQGNKVYVPVEVEVNDKPLEMLYKFYSSSEGWKAYDVEVNGVSLIKSYQAQFSEVLKKGTAEDLLTELKKSDVK
jgi:phospholipid transport system substrate-binding protein